MIWFLLQKVGFFIFVILTAYFVLKKKYESLLTLYFFGLTFNTFFYFYVTTWNPSKIVKLGMVVCLFLESYKRKSTAINLVYSTVILFIVTILLSDIIGLAFPGKYAPQLSRGIRMFNASFTYLTATAMLLFGLILKPGFVKRIFPSYCLAVEIAIASGVIHYVCLKSGIGFMPIMRQFGDPNIEAVANMGGSLVNRIYGFAGEPKNLGFLVCPYVLILVMMLGRGVYRINKTYHLIALGVGLFVLINTYSSSALLNFFFALPIVLLLLPFPKITYKAGTVILLACVAASFWLLSKNTYIYPYKSGESSFVTQIYERTFVRAEDELENDRQETVVFNHFINEGNVIFKIFGWGVAQYTFHVPNQVLGNNRLIPMQSGIVMTIVDFGLLGLLLLGFVSYVIIKLLILSIRSSSIYALAFSVATLSSFIGSLMYGNIVTCFIYLMLAIYSYYDEQESSIIKS